MRSGKLKRVITIQQATTELNDVGTPEHAWTDFAVMRADVERVSTEEFIRAFGASDETVVIFRTRYIEGVSNACRVLFEERVFNLKEVVDLGRRGGLELRGVEAS